jgi:hypothetical protein
MNFEMEVKEVNANDDKLRVVRINHFFKQNE